jgi:hypothetical protein
MLLKESRLVCVRLGYVLYLDRLSDYGHVPDGSGGLLFGVPVSKFSSPIF